MKLEHFIFNIDDVKYIMLFLERILFPDKAAKRAERILQERQEEARIQGNIERRMKAYRKSQEYLSELKTLENAEITTLDDKLGTVIQLYHAPNPTQVSLLVPGDGSTGQSRKYDWLIADLLRNNVSVARVNNQSHIDFGMQDFLTPDDYLRAYHDAYKKYMTEHFGVINKYLSASGFVDQTKVFNVIGSSAGATAVLALYNKFDSFPQSLTLLGPSGDIAPQDALSAANTYISDGGKINVVVGDYDDFQFYEPCLSLKQMSMTNINVSASKISTAGHDLRGIDPKGDYIQAGLHREIFRSFGLPYAQLDEVFGDFECVTSL